MRPLQLPALVLYLLAPVTAQNPTFEVVSVRPVPIPRGQKAIDPVCVSGNYRAPVRGVAASIRFAYNLAAWQLAGIPDWSTRQDAAFDIEAKSTGPVSEAECRLMVQSLLADRFHLVVHRETRTMPIVEMTVAKGGTKIQPWKESDRGLPVEINGAGAYDSEHGWTIAQFTEFATRSFSGTPVIDHTGLTGSYRIRLDFRPTAPRASRTASDVEAEFESAVERQMGLTFQIRKEPAEVVVIDRLERPTAN